MTDVDLTYYNLGDQMEIARQSDMMGGSFFEFSLAMILIMIVIGLICYAISSFLMGRIFKKAGVEQWKAWVPIYSTWVMLEIGGQKGWYVLLAFIPFVGAIIAAVFGIIAMYHIGKNLGKSDAFVLLAIFLPVIWAAILAFDKSTWAAAQPVAAGVNATPVPQPAPDQFAAPAPEPTPVATTPEPTVEPTEPVETPTDEQ
jgi:hypothetical protein